MLRLCDIKSCDGDDEVWRSCGCMEAVQKLDKAYIQITGLTMDVLHELISQGILA